MNESLVTCRKDAKYFLGIQGADLKGDGQVPTCIEKAYLDH